MFDHLLDIELTRIAVAQAGAFTARQAFERGCTRSMLHRRERSGLLHRVRQGLYVHTGFPETWKQRLWLEILGAGEGSAASTKAAAALHGFRRSEPGAVEVQTSEGGSHSPIIGTVHETFWMPPSHVVHLDGLPVT